MHPRTCRPSNSANFQSAWPCPPTRRTEPLLPPRHSPYDGGHTPFAIGLSPLDLSEWIDVDEHLAGYLAEKARLAELHTDRVFVAEAGTRDAQQEVLELLSAHLLARFPAVYWCDGAAISIADADCDAVLLNGSEPPLQAAARLVAEDLVLMRRGESGWRLTAASVSFPSGWSLTEKFGKPLADIHAPVPNFGAGSRNAKVIDRIFDNLQVDQPVARMNWSLRPDAELYQPQSSSGLAPRFEALADAANTFIRVERQTLRKLSVSGDILFTIRIYVDPLSSVTRHADGRRIAVSFVAQLLALNTAQLDYKGLRSARDATIAALRKIADG